MEHFFVCMQIFHRHGHGPSSGQELRPGDSQSVGLGGWNDRGGGGPGSELGSSSETGSDRAFRIAKPYTMKRVDHKR